MKYLLSVVLLVTSISIAISQSLSNNGKIVASDRAEDDWFGYSVSISHDWALVSSWFNDTDSTSSNLLGNAGAVYFLQKQSNGNWIQKQKVVPSDRAADDYFGFAIAISGRRAIIGAPNEDENVSGGNFLGKAGSAYIFELDSNGFWGEVQKIVPSDRFEADQFGYSVAIDSNYIVVGAPYQDRDEIGLGYQPDAGAAYIFERNSLGVYKQKKKICAEHREYGGGFGASVAIDQNTILVGSPYEGTDVDSLNFLSFSGSAYLFERDTLNKWDYRQKITASARQTDAIFGRYLDIHGDNLIVAAPRDSSDENLANPLREAGAAYLFKRTNGMWSQTQKIAGTYREVQDDFGCSVSIYEDKAIVGSRHNDTDANGANSLSNAGVAYLFRRNGTGDWSLDQKFIPGDRKTDDNFGIGVGIFKNQIIAGAHGQSYAEPGSKWIDGAGAVYMFVSSPTGIEDTRHTSIVKCYPNPTRDFVNMQFDKTYSTIKIEVYNLEGKIISENGIEDVDHCTLRIPEPTGLYLVRLSLDGQTSMVRVMKE